MYDFLHPLHAYFDMGFCLFATSVAENLVCLHWQRERGSVAINAKTITGPVLEGAAPFQQSGVAQACIWNYLINRLVAG